MNLSNSQVQMAQAAGLPRFPHHRDTSAMEFPEEHSWRELINKLWCWEPVAEQEDEDGRITPSRNAIQVARELVNCLRSARSGGLPRRVVPDGDGGIIIELPGEEGFSASLEIDASGAIEFFLFTGTKVLIREQVNLASIQGAKNSMLF